MANDKNDADQQLAHFGSTSAAPRDEADRYFIGLLTRGWLASGWLAHDGRIDRLPFDWPLDIEEPSSVHDFEGAIPDFQAAFAEVVGHLEDEGEQERLFTELWEKYFGKN